MTIGVDVAQTGLLADEALVPPLVRRWQVVGSARQILAADGRVYVISDKAVRALDQADGKELWVAPFDLVQAAAYDSGTVYIARGTIVRALDAATGAVRWTATPDSSGRADGMVASGGFIYLPGNAEVFALHASNGAQAWKKATVDTDGSPALDGERIYLTGECEATVALRRQDGAEIWRHQPTCNGGGNHTPALYGGRLWTARRSNASAEAPVFDAGTGAVALRHPGGRPVFVDGVAVTAVGDTSVRAIDAATAQQRWEVKGRFVHPVAVGHDVYSLTANDSGDDVELVALDGETGSVLWSEKVEGSIDSGSNAPAIGVAPGLLVVGVGGKLTAYESVFRPAPNAIELGSDVFEESRVVGRTWLGSSARPSGRTSRRPSSSRLAGHAAASVGSASSRRRATAVSTASPGSPATPATASTWAARPALRSPSTRGHASR